MGDEPAALVTHPAADLDEVVHQRFRLGILAIACESNQTEFGYLRTALELTAGNLSRHLDVLREAGLIEISKGYDGKRPRTWVEITPAGRSALQREIAALTALTARVSQPPARAASSRARAVKQPS